MRAKKIFSIRNATIPALLLTLVLATPASAGRRAGELDETFGGTGVVGVYFPEKWGSLQAFWDVLINDHSKVVAVGSVHSDDTSRFALTRRTANGARDTKFAGDGKRTTAFAEGPSAAYRVVLAGQGRILVGGNAGGSFALARYLPDGRLDPAFGNGGKVTTDVPTNVTTGWDGDVIQDIAVRNDTITVVGLTAASYGDTEPAGRGLAWARYHANGEPDLTFGTGGIRVAREAPPGSYSFEHAVMQPDGKTVVGGGGDGTLLFARYNPDGTLDDSFGTAGVTEIMLGDDADGAVEEVAIGADGQIAAAGYEAWGDYYDVVVAQLTADGQKDWVSGYDGGFSGAYADAVAVQDDGRVLAAGYKQGFALFRFTPSGQLDSSFSDDGKVINRKAARGFAVTVGEGRVVAGSTAYGPKPHAVLFRFHK